jgi:hypothetical protein
VLLGFGASFLGGVLSEEKVETTKRERDDVVVSSVDSRLRDYRSTARSFGECPSVLCTNARSTCSGATVRPSYDSLLISNEDSSSSY